MRDSTIGKLVIFAGLEAGVGKAICAANVAVRLSQRWKCVVIDMDGMGGMDGASGSLHKYLGVPPPDPRAWESCEDPFTSLPSFKVKTRFANLDFIHWSAEFPPVDLLRQTLQSYPADYVFVTLNPGASDAALDLYAAADVPILVTNPSGPMQDKVLDFLRRFSWRGFGEKRVHIILNQLQRGGEERENTALIEKARHSFGLNVNVFGTVLYNPDAMTNIFLGGAPSPLRTKSQTALIFEDMTFKIERLLPRSHPAAATSADPAAKGRAVTARRAVGFIATLSESARDAVSGSIGGKARKLEEELRRKDEIIRSLHQRYDTAVADLQQMLKNKNVQVAEHAASIQSLQEEIRQSTDRLSERTNRFLDLENTISRREAEIRHLQDQIQRFEETNATLALDRSDAMRRVTEQLADRTRQAGEAEYAIAEKHAEIRRLEGELSRIREANIELTNAIAQEKQEKLASQELNQSAGAELAELRRKSGELAERISSQAKLESDFKDEIEAGRIKIQRIEDELSRVREANRVLAEEKASVQQASRETAGRTPEIRRLEEEIGRLTESTRVLADEKSALQRTNQGIAVERNETVRRLTKQLTDETKRAAEREAAITANRSEIQRLQEELGRGVEPNQDLPVLMEQLAAHAKRASELEATIEAGREDVHRLEDELNELRNANSLLAEQLAERTARAAELEALIAARQADDPLLDGELNRLKEVNSALAEDNRALQCANDSIVEERQETIRQFTEQLAQQRKRASELEAGVAAAQSEIHRFEEANRMLALEKAALKLTNEGIVSEGNETVRQLREQLFDRSTRASELETAMAANRSEIVRLGETLSAEISGRTRKATELENTVVAANSEIERLRRELNALADEKVALRREIDGAAVERDETRRRLAEEISKESIRADEMGELETAIASQRKAVEQLQIEIRRLTGMNELFMEEKTTLRHENERLVTERNNIGRRVAELEDVLREREALIERKDKMIQDVEVRLAQRTSAHNAVEDRTAEALRQLSCEIALQREDSRAMVDSCRSLAQSIEQLTRVVTEQVNDTAHLREHLRLEISEVEESRRVKYTTVQPAERAKRLRAVSSRQPKLENVNPSENTSARLELETLLRQRRVLVETLRRQPPHSVTIIPIIEGGKDSFDFAIELQAILEAGGWSVGFVTSTFEANQFYGLHMVTDGSNLAQSTAGILSGAFRKTGLGFTETTAELSGGIDPVRLIVGIHNVGQTVASAFN